jgi:hypothetical protein
MKKGVHLTRFLRNQLPRAGGSLSPTGMSGSRKQKLSAASGTNPRLFGGTSLKRQGFSQTSAPHKQIFSSNIGIEGPEEGLPP